MNPWFRLLFAACHAVALYASLKARDRIVTGWPGDPSKSRVLRTNARLAAFNFVLLSWHVVKLARYL